MGVEGDCDVDPLVGPSDLFDAGFCWPQAERKTPKATATTILLAFAQALDFMRLATTASLSLDSTHLEVPLLAISRPLNAILHEMKNQVCAAAKS